MPSLLRHHSLELSSVKELPDSHVWQALDHDHDHPSVDPSSSDPIPIIDISSPDAAALISQACEDWGVFQIRGHGVSHTLLASLESESRRLFSLPMHRKLRAARSPGSLSGYGLAPISSFFSKLMWSEGFTISGSPVAQAARLWPSNHAQFCDVIQAYEEEIKKLADRVMRLMLTSLGVGVEDFMRWVGPKAQELSGVLQLNSYPACPDPGRAMGLAAHTDSSILTLLYQSNISGLQVLRDGGGGPGRAPAPARWVTVPPLPGALVVNVGDMLHILTNGRFKSVLHRAVVNRTRHRLSAAYFCGPSKDVRVEPMGSLVDLGKEPAYRAVTWAEYLGLKAKLFDKALASLKKEDPAAIVQAQPLFVIARV